MKRNPSIELYRCFLVYGICLLHTIGNSLGEDLWASSCLMFCVDGFIVISGYFAIRFSWKKIAMLELTGIWCAFASCVLLGGTSGGGGGLIANSYDAFLHYWFLHSYVILMIFAPMLNTYVDSLKRKGTKDVLTELIPLCILCFGWSWATSYNATHGLIPRASGLGHFTFLTMIGVYVIGRLFRHYESRIVFDKRLFWLLMISSGLFAMLRLGFYNSPFAVVLALGSFVLVKDMHVDGTLAVLVNFVAPSAFVVYLLHTTPYGLNVAIPRLVSAVQPYLGKWSAYLACAAAIFIIGVVVDCLKRGVVSVVKAFAKK